jgi:hypothetical protein
MEIAGVFGFGNGDEVVGQKFKAFKGEAGRTNRVSFVWFPIKEGKFDLTAATPSFIGNQTHYLPNVGYIINKGPEYTKIAGGEAPKLRIGAIIAVWPTDKLGNLQNDRVMSEFEVMPWIFSGDKFNQLKSIHGEFGFGSHDLKLNCSDATFQKMTFSPTSDSVLAKFNNAYATNEKAKAVIDKLVASVQALIPKMPGNIGREMTIQQIREKLAGGGAGGPAAPNVGGDAVAGGAVDSIVDSLLDG